MQKKFLLHSCCGPCSIMCLEYLQKNQIVPHVFYYNPNIHPQKEFFLRLHTMQAVAQKYGVSLVVGNNRDFFERIRQERHLLDKKNIQAQHHRIFLADDLMKKAVDKILNKWKMYAELFPCKEFENLSVYADASYWENPDFATLQSLLVIDSYAFVSHLKNYQEMERCKICYKERMLRSVSYAKEQGFVDFSSTLLYSRYQCHEDICQAIEDAIHIVNQDIVEKTKKIRFYYVDFRNFWQEGIDKSKEWNLYRQKWCGCILSRLESLEQMAQREYEKLMKRQADSQAKLFT